MLWETFLGELMAHPDFQSMKTVPPTSAVTLHADAGTKLTQGINVTGLGHLQ